MLFILCPLGAQPTAILTGVAGRSLGVGAVLTVHRNAEAAGDKADDAVAGNGRTALGELHHAVVQAFHDHARVGDGLSGLLCLRRQLGFLGLGGLDAGGLVLDLGNDAAEGYAAVADTGIQLFQIGDIHTAADQFLHLDGLEGIKDQIGPQFPLQNGLALLDILLPALFFEPLLNLGAGAVGFDDLHPVPLGTGGVFGSNNIHDFTAVQLTVDGNDSSVDLGSGHPVADGRVDGVCKVNGGSTLGQVDHVAPGRKHINLVGKEVGFDIFDKVGGIGILLTFDQLTHPGEGSFLLGALQAVFILPVGSDAVFGLGIHLLRADLHLKGDALSTDDHGMQTLVAVGLGGTDIVLETTGNGLIQVMDQTQHVIAVGQRLDDHAGGADIIQLRKTQILTVQLTVNAVNTLQTGLYLTLNAHLIQLFDDSSLGFVQKIGKTVVLLLQIVGNLLITHGIQDLQTAVFQLPLNILDTQTVGQGRINLHGFHRDIPLFLFPLELNGAHIVQTVGQLDHDHANVLCHGNEHLAQVFHLLLFLGGIAGMLHLGQLGNAIHQHGHRFAEFFGYLGIAGFGILNGVMEQTGHNGLGVQTHLLDVYRHRHRMHDIGLAAFAQLAVMMLVGIVISPEDALFFLFRESRCNFIDLLIEVFQIFPHFLFVHRINPSISPSMF